MTKMGFIFEGLNICKESREQNKENVKFQTVVPSKAAALPKIPTSGSCFILPVALDDKDDGVDVIGKQDPSQQAKHLREWNNVSSKHNLTTKFYFQ